MLKFSKRYFLLQTIQRPNNIDVRARGKERTYVRNRNAEVLEKILPITDHPKGV